MFTHVFVNRDKSLFIQSHFLDTGNHFGNSIMEFVTRVGILVFVTGVGILVFVTEVGILVFKVVHVYNIIWKYFSRNMEIKFSILSF